MLAVQSVPAQLSATDSSATLRAIVVDGASSLDGGPERARTIRWFFCNDSHTSDPVGCARAQTAHAMAGDGDTLTVARASLSAQGSRTVLVALCPGVVPASYDSASSIINCPDERGRAWAETEGVLAFYTVKSAENGAIANRAPVIESLSIGPERANTVTVARCASEPCPAIDWVLTPDALSAETVDATTETLTASFFATQGTFDRPRAVTATGSNGRDGSLRVRWTAPRAEQTVRGWVVLRDDRGASAVVERTIVVR